MKELQNKPQPVDCNSISAAGVKFLAAVKYSADVIREIERATRGQRLCKRWQEERQLRMTASKFGLVIKRHRNHTALVVKQLLYAKGVAALVWGQQHEQDALDAYKATLGSDFSVREA